MILRLADKRHPHPTAAILDSRTLQSTPESGARAGYDGAKRCNGSKAHLGVDTLGHFLALHVTAANQQDRDQVEHLCKKVQEVTEQSVELHMLIKPTRASVRLKWLRHKALHSKLSNCPKRRHADVASPC